jgi:hypothetical protein
VKRILGQHLLAIASHCNVSKSAVLEGFVRGFERTKKRFDGTEDEDIKIPFDLQCSLPNLTKLPILKPHYLRVAPAYLLEMFTKYSDHIIDLISDQVSKIRKLEEYDFSTKQIILCGGGSYNDFLFNAVSMHFQGKGISCLRKEPNDHSLVSKGAFLATFNPSLARREHARTSFGTTINVEWDKTKHMHLKSARSRAEACSGWEYELKRRMLWLVKKDDPVNEVFTAQYINQIARSPGDWEGDLEAEQPVYSCEVEPIATTQEISYFKNRRDIRPAGRLVMRLTEQQHDKFERHKVEGGTEYIEVH